MRCRMSPLFFASVQVKGYPVMTIAKGDVIVEDGEFKGEKGKGEFIKRKINPDYLERYGLN